MPTVSRFFGIAIRIYYDDHAPFNFHVYYGEEAATVDIETLRVRSGRVSRRALALVLEWAADHRDELFEDWRLAETHQPLNPIDPLE